MLRSHFCTIFFSKYILCNALFILLRKKNGGSPTFLGNLKMVTTKKWLGTTGIEVWHGTYQNNTSKIFVHQKKAIRAINNIAYNQHTNAYFKCNKILKLSDQYKIQIFNYIFQLLHSNIDEEIESSLLINNQIHSHNTRTNNQMSILPVNISKTKHCVLRNFMITWNSLPDLFKVNVSFSLFKSKVRKFYLEKS